MNMSDESARSSIGLADFIQGRTRALRVSDVATLLDVSERLVYRLCAEGLVPFFRIGGSIRFDPASISGWLRQKMAPAPVKVVAEQRRRA